MDQLAGKIDIKSATAFLHFFRLEDQIRACIRMVEFLRLITGDEKDKQVIFGRQSATTKPRLRVRVCPKWGRNELYLHDFGTFDKLWEDVGLKTGTRMGG